jgi:hypothetical protein
MHPQFDEFIGACWHDESHALRMLARDPTLKEARNGTGETVLHYSAIENGVDAVRFLLSIGANPDSRDDFDTSPLQSCVAICPKVDLIRMIRLLLDAGADPYHWCETSACAWHLAEFSTCEPLRALFAALPPPAEEHEDCELWRELMASKIRPDDECC